MFDLFLKLQNYRENLDAKADFAEALEMNLQQDANADVTAILAREDAMDTDQMENVIEERVKKATAPLQKKLQKIRQQMKSKGTGGKPGHLSNASSNGQNRSKASTGSSDSSAGKKSNRSNRNQNRQNRNGKGRGRGNQRGSGRGGRGNGSKGS